MSIYVEPKVGCSICGEIEPSCSVICLDNMPYKKTIHDELKDCFPDWTIKKDGEVICPACRGKLKC